MADPICRWRNPYIDTVRLLIETLPKEELPREIARERINQNFPLGDFFRTAYQTACQLGLYHETGDFYFPKFTHLPSDIEIQNYLNIWITTYCVPNPYTRSIGNIQPFCIHAEISNMLYNSRSPLNWENVIDNLFHNNIGNKDILRNSINAHSLILSIDGGVVRLKDGKSYDDLLTFREREVLNDRNNKELFFDLISINNIVQREQNIDNLSIQDIELLNEIQNLDGVSQTEKNQLITARIGQGLFRRNLIQNCGQCPITNINDFRLLIASHIKPWKDSNNFERLDVFNGIMLTPTYDRLFDKGFISFNNDRSIILSNLIANDVYDRLNLTNDLSFPNLSIQGREDYFDYHRNEVFKN